MTPDERLVVDPETGGAKGAKLARYDLIPVRPLRALAEHYGKGATKYERSYDWKTGPARLLTAIENSTQSHSVAPATKKICDDATQALRIAKETTLTNGGRQTEDTIPAGTDVIQTGQNLTHENPFSENTEWKSQTTNFYSPSKAVSAPSAQAYQTANPDFSILTTTTELAEFGASCADAATRELAYLEMMKRVLERLSPFFPVLQRFRLTGVTNGSALRETGDRNWELGYKWSLSYAAAQRHFNAWWGGEEYDEDGNHHLDAVMFHVMALREYGWTNLKNDDRVKDVGVFVVAEDWFRGNLDGTLDSHPGLS